MEGLSLPDVSEWQWRQLLPMDTDAFLWTVGKTPLSGWGSVFVAWALYWTTILVGKRLMANREPFVLRTFTAGHNLVLCLWSLGMCAGLSYHFLYQRLDVSDLSSVYCSGKAPDAASVYYWLYIYYLSKYYELLDTVIRVLKKKEIIFLHWYHHSVVLATTYTWVGNRILFSGHGMFANTLVHVFMYNYYFQSTLGRRVWYKKYITVMQLVQFSASFLLFIPYVYFSWNGDCDAAERVPVAISMAVNVSFFLLFSQFYAKTYKKPPPDSGAKKAS